MTFTLKCYNINSWVITNLEIHYKQPLFASHTFIWDIYFLLHVIEYVGGITILVCLLHLLLAIEEQAVAQEEVSPGWQSECGQSCSPETISQHKTSLVETMHALSLFSWTHNTTALKVYYIIKVKHVIIILQWAHSELRLYGFPC